MTIDKKNNLYILSFRKITIFDENGKYLSSFSIDFSPNDIVTDNQNNLIILGFKFNKIFHLYNYKGDYLGSFGDIFDPPSEYFEYKKIPQLKIPFRVYCTKNSNLFIINPFKYEIKMYKNKNLKSSIVRETDQYKAPKVKKIEYPGAISFAVMLTNYSILKHQNKLYVSFQLEKEGYQMDIFENYKYICSIKTKDFLQAIDEEGRIYSVDNSEIPKVTRYFIKIT